MTASAMTLERFEALVAAYGGAEGAWPEAERDAAIALCETSARARALRDDAHALDTALGGTAEAIPSKFLEARIMASFSPSRRDALPRQRWLGAGAIAACLVVGIVAGWAILRTQHDAVDLSDPAAWDLIGEDLEFPVSNS
jgi:ferric-dicitrate binding protein FerR (iron transport regulator)